jgi:hypothetical protein
LERLQLTDMKALLRLISVWLGVFVLIPMLFLAWHFVGIRPAAASTLRDTATAIAVASVMLAFIALGVLGMHRLWHLRESGRRITAALLAVWLALFVVIAVQAGSAGGVIRLLIVNAAAIAILLSPAAKRTCR